jgi:hypothetical protein
MIYERNHNGHEILFWPICSARTLWSASDNFLFVDGKLVSRSGGMCFHSHAKATFLHNNTQVSVEMRTKTSVRGPIHLDYQLLIGELLIDCGTIRMSYMWKIPQNIEQAAAQRRCKLQANAHSMSLEEARASLKADDAPFVKWCEAAGVLCTSPDSTIEDWLLCLTRRGLPAEAGACKLYVRTKRPRQDASLESFVVDADDWRNYLKREKLIA